MAAELTLEQRKALAIAQARRRAAEGANAPNGQASATGADGNASFGENVQAYLEKRQQEGRPPIPLNGTDPTLADVGRQFQKGLVQGATGIVTFPAYAGRWLGDKAMSAIDGAMGRTPEEIEQSRQKAAEVQQNMGWMDPVSVAESLAGSTGVGDPKTTAGRFANTTGQFLPGILMGRPTRITSAAPGATMAPMAASATTAAVGSEGGGMWAEKNWPEAEPYMRLAGALTGSAIPSIVGKLVTPNAIPAAKRAMIKTLDKAGIQTTAGQQTGSKALRYMESELGGGKAADIMDTQAEQFTKAAASKAGITADRLTGDVMDKAFTDIGTKFETLAAKTPIPLDKTLQDDLLSAVTDYQAVSGQPAAAAEEIMNRVAELSGKNGGVLSGEAYKDISSLISKYQRSSGTEAGLKQALTDMRMALDDAVERNLSGDLLKEWKTTRNQYRNMLVLEDTIAKGGEKASEGLISPARFRQSTVTKQGKRNYVRGEGDYAELARAGESIMTPLPDSGTAGRTAARNLGTGLTSAIGAGIGSASGNPMMAVIGALAGAAAPYAAGRALLSKPVQAYLTNQIFGGRKIIGPIERALIAGAGTNVNVANTRK